MKILIKEKQEIAQGTVLFTFDAPGAGLSWEPGQYVSLKLDLRFPDEKGPQRYFSIVNPDPENGRIQIATRVSDTWFQKTSTPCSPGRRAKLPRLQENSFFRRRKKRLSWWPAAWGSPCLNACWNI
ncbi:MAG: FAD-binding oxidoreductase [Desulfobacterales bacterium]